jgi:predicted house-cleaning noncanonical NTP pyrophosphatase (MazG superfamily)
MILGSILYNKLVRDKIPQIIEESGKIPVVETLDDETYKKLLDEKLKEELDEYLSSDKVEELADLVEVVHAILRYKGIDTDTFENIRAKKAIERGAFEKRLLLKEVLDR